MLIYSPLDGLSIPGKIKSHPKSCFLITPISDVSKEVLEIQSAIKEVCIKYNFSVIDSSEVVTGRDFLLKIWK